MAHVKEQGFSRYGAKIWNHPPEKIKKLKNLPYLKKQSRNISRITFHNFIIHLETTVVETTLSEKPKELIVFEYKTLIHNMRGE